MPALAVGVERAPLTEVRDDLRTGLLAAALDRMRTKPSRGEQLARWMRTVMLHHSGFITTSAKAMRNPERGVVSRPIIEEREFREVFGMIVQELSFDIIEAMRFAA